MPQYNHNTVEPNSQRWLSLQDLPNERWLPIKGYEQSYMISSYGRIKAIDRTLTFSDGRVRAYKSRIIRTHRINQHYYVASLSQNQRRIMKDVHRLVAEAFIPNPNGFKEINHKDENSLNNCIDNLEWCTRKYNNNYGSHNKKVSESIMNCPSTSKPVVQMKPDGTVIQTFPSIREAARSLGDVKRDCNILRACQGINKTCFGYKWSYL